MTKEPKRIISSYILHTVLQYCSVLIVYSLFSNVTVCSAAGNKSHKLGRGLQSNGIVCKFSHEFPPKNLVQSRFFSVKPSWSALAFRHSNVFEAIWISFDCNDEVVKCKLNLPIVEFSQTRLFARHVVMIPSTFRTLTELEGVKALTSLTPPLGLPCLPQRPAGSHHRRRYFLLSVAGDDISVICNASTFLFSRRIPMMEHYSL